MAPQSSISKKISIALLGNMAVPIAGFATAPILAHALSVNDRGEVAAATAPFLLGISLFTLGLPEALTYLISRGHVGVREMFSKAAAALTLCGLGASFAVYCFSGILSGGAVHLARLTMAVSCLLAPALVIALARGVAAGVDAWGLITLERSLGALLRLCAILFLLSTGDLRVWSASFAVAGSVVMSGSVYLALLKHNYRARANRLDVRPRRRELTSYSARIWLGSAAGILLARVDQVLIAPLSSAYQLGLYAIAVSVAELVLVLNSAVRDVLFSSESKFPDNSLLTSSARISTALTAAAAVTMGVTAYWFLPFLFGEAYQQSYLPLVVLLAGIVLGNPGSVAGAGLSARGKPGLRSISILAAVCVNVAMLLVLVPAFGAVGASLCTAVGNIVASSGNILFLRFKCQVPVSSFFGICRDDVRAVQKLLSRLSPLE